MQYKFPDKLYYGPPLLVFFINCFLWNQNTSVKILQSYEDTVLHLLGQGWKSLLMVLRSNLLLLSDTLNFFQIWTESILRQ